jgi:hypothetical protein
MTWVGVGWSQKGYSLLKGLILKLKNNKILGKKKVSIKAPPNHLKNMLQICWFLYAYSFIKKRGG